MFNDFIYHKKKTENDIKSRNQNRKKGVHKEGKLR